MNCIMLISREILKILKLGVAYDFCERSAGTAD